jgi:hypothetical protein
MQQRRTCKGESSLSKPSMYYHPSWPLSLWQDSSQNGRLPAYWLESERSVPDFGTNARFQSLLPKSGQSDSDENCLDSGYSGQNPVKAAGILPVSDEILSPVIFILFYINIYMFCIKINFYKLIWLNENIKNICDFSYASNIEKYFRRKTFSWKMRRNHFTSKQTEH